MIRIPGLLVMYTLCLAIAAGEVIAEIPRDMVTLRAWGVPGGYDVGPLAEAERRIMDTFRQKYPWINPVPATGLNIPGGAKTMDMVPLMQIAGGIAPDVLYVNFRYSQYYVDKRLLLPLDEYVEQLAGVDLSEEAQLLPNEKYVALLREGPNWSEIEDRVPEQCWPVIRRKDPKGEGYHIYAFPLGPVAIGLMYDKIMFAEHGLPMRAPRDWEEMLDWAKQMTDPMQSEYGLHMDVALPSWAYANFVYAAGGQLVEEQPDGTWRCTLDSDAAVEAGYLWARLRHEKVMRDGEEAGRGVVLLSEPATGATIRYGMRLTYLDDQFLREALDQTKGFGPVPMGPQGTRGSEFNARMVGIFSGLSEDPDRAQAAWDYIQFYDGPEARRIRVEAMVQAGLGRFMREKQLVRFNDNGRYDSEIRRIPPELTETFAIAFEHGVPEPYGPNCSPIYDELHKYIAAIWTGDQQDELIAAIDAGDEPAAKAIIRGILARGTEHVNTKLFGRIPPEVRQQRGAISWTVIIVTLGAFAVVLWMVMKAFTPKHHRELGGWQFRRYWKAYALAAPALLLIGLWQYWPMVNGTAIAFQDYNVLGGSEWVGADNFSAVLFSGEFWYSVKVSLYYLVLFMVFGFCAPIGLAFLLSEVPRGKIVFRTIYYLPAVLSGVVVIFLWKSFYSPDGMINQLLNSFVWMINGAFETQIAPFAKDWLQDPMWAMFFCVLPTAWAGMGPGCLIYLAALKTIPDDLYEAADIDGAGLRHKFFNVALPTIKILVMINFIGAMIGAFRGSGGFILAMTGGGPFSESGGVTEVVGLKLFYTTFGYLQFGVGAAMAWVIGAMLIGFTVYQLKRLSNVEFRTAEGGA